MTAIEDAERLAVARRIRAARIRAGLSQQATADQAGLLRTALSDIERACRRVDALELARLARATGTTAAELLGEHDQAVDVDAGNVPAELAHLVQQLAPADRRSVEVFAGYLHWRQVQPLRRN